MLRIFPASHRKPGALHKANVHRHSHNKTVFPCAVMGNKFSAYKHLSRLLLGSKIFLFLDQVNNLFLNVENLLFTDVDL